MSNSPETNNSSSAGASPEQGNSALDRDDREALGTIQTALDTEPEVEATKTDDKEILGQSGHLRRSMHDTTRSFLNFSHEGTASLINEVAQVRSHYLEKGRDLARRKNERKQLKRGTSNFKFINRHHDRVANAYQARYDKAGDKLENHKKKMQQRADRATQASQDRDEAHQKLVDFYVYNKIRKERQKELRALYRNQRIGGSSRIESHRFVRDLSKAEKQRITNEAIEAIRKENIRKGKLDANYVVPE